MPCIELYLFPLVLTKLGRQRPDDLQSWSIRVNLACHTLLSQAVMRLLALPPTSVLAGLLLIAAVATLYIARHWR